MPAVSPLDVSSRLWLPFVGVVAFGLAYLLLFAGLARFGQRPPPPGRRPFFVFVIPCLNEELVIGRCLDKLLAQPSTDFAILVVDDGSDDGTAAVVAGYDPARVWLLRREPPYARQGKGAALNAAYRHLWNSGHLGRFDPNDVVVAVVDADGRLQPDALDTVAPYFQHPRVGAVQIGVRMYNAHESLLARMQDIEFVVFTEIYQRARRHLGTVGLGGNGQFVRLAALRSLEDSPWTDCLTEDLDLGIRLRVHGWVSEYTGRTWVEQQAVTSLPRLIRQRARWFQGHLQCSRRIPVILQAGLPLHTTLDLCWHLLGPVTILLMSLWSALFVASLAYLWVSDPAGSWQTITTRTWILPGFYVLSMAPAVLYGWVYRRQTRTMPRRHVLVLSHLFTIYGYLWFLAGWRALWQVSTGRRGWAKTSRTAERQTAEAVALAVPELDWQLAVPPSWQVVEASLDRVAYQDPSRPAFVHVDRVVGPASPLEGPLRDEVAYWGYGYRRLGLRMVPFKGRPAALWEFVYRSDGMLVHAQELQVVAGGIRYVVNVRSPQTTWARRSGMLKRIQESFEVLGG
jgi:1,2-diacylglycerol 3-beta-glucosyltransferase